MLSVCGCNFLCDLNKRVWYVSVRGAQSVMYCLVDGLVDVIGSREEIFLIGDIGHQAGRVWWLSDWMRHCNGFVLLVGSRTEIARGMSVN